MIVFSGMFNAGAKLSVADGKLVIEKEGKLKNSSMKSSMSPSPVRAVSRRDRTSPMSRNAL